MEAESNTILNVSLHPLENLSRNLDGADNSAQARRKKHDVGGGLYDLCQHMRLVLQNLMLTCAASEAPSTAIPQSDFFKEGASFTPSPVDVLARTRTRIASNGTERRAYQS